MRKRDRIILYSLLIGIIATGGLIYNHLANGTPIQLERLIFVMLLLPVFGYFMWLRWDWAPEEGRKARERRRREREER